MSDKPTPPKTEFLSEPALTCDISGAWMTNARAHEFNNILGAIIGYTELAQENFPENSPGQQDLKKVLDACNRAKALIDQILEPSR